MYEYHTFYPDRDGAYGYYIKWLPLLTNLNN